jgi:hypothetical protein
MLRMDQIADKQNFLAALQAKGYTVESPAR